MFEFLLGIGATLLAQRLIRRPTSAETAFVHGIVTSMRGNSSAWEHDDSIPYVYRNRITGVRFTGREITEPVQFRVSWASYWKLNVAGRKLRRASHTLKRAAAAKHLEESLKRMSNVSQ